MQDEQCVFSVPEAVRRAEIGHWLADCGRLQTEPPIDLVRIFFDTFDWRLYRAGSSLEITEHDGRYKLVWRRLGSGHPLAQSRVKSIPKFAEDIVAPGLRQQLKALLGVRALFPQVSINSNTQVLRLLDNDDKTTLRVELRRDRVIVPQSTRYYSQPDFAYFFAYRGYQDVFHLARQRLSGKRRLQAPQKDPLLLALDRLQIDPASFYAMPKVELEKSQGAGPALQTVLSALLNIMERNIDGACNDEDPEFLHDFLLAERRTQCLVERYWSVLPKTGLNLIKQDLKWIEEITAPIRSLDIHLELFDDYLSRVDRKHRSALAPLRKFMLDQKVSEHRKVQIPLGSPRYSRLMKALRRLLAERISGDSEPILVVAGQVIYDLYQEILQLGMGITADTPAEKLLEMQQLSKRLGYQLEIFGELFPSDKMKRVQKRHRRLFANLHAYHDLRLQHRALRDYQTRMIESQRTMPAWLEAIDLLIEDLDREQIKTRSEFDDRFSRFSDNKTQQRFRSLFSGRDGAR